MKWFAYACYIILICANAVIVLSKTQSGLVTGVVTLIGIGIFFSGYLMRKFDEKT